MSRRILVISNYSGAINPVRPEVEIFKGLSSQGFDVFIMTPRQSAFITELTASGCTIIDHLPQSKFDMNSIKLIRSTVSEYRIDIVHAFNSKAIANAAWALMFNSKVKLVSYRGYTGNIHWYDPSLYISFLNPRIDYMVCLAESVREMYLRNGVSKDRAITINKGHHPDWYADIQPADLSEFKVDPESMVCSFVANFRTKMKGIIHLIKAVADLPAGVKVVILMIGDGLNTQEVLQWLDEYGVTEKFIFTGFRKDASNLVKACSVSISLSLFGEATQKAMIEAMYLGNPVIISDISGNRGMVKDGEGGYVVPPASSKEVTQALVKLYEHPELRTEMGEKSRKHIAQYLSVDRTVEEYGAFYEGIA